MTDLLLHPLLQGGNDAIGAIIFFVIWALIAILSQVGKWQEKKRQREQQMHVPPPVPPELQQPRPRPQRQPMQRPPQQPFPQQLPFPQQPFPQQPPVPQQQQRRPARRPPQMPQRKPVPVRVAEPELPPVQRYQPPLELTGKMADEIGSSTERGKFIPAVTPREIREALQPTSLRKQILLLELLQPPLALRQQRET